MSEVEEFGVEEFGAELPEAAPAADPAVDREDLKAMLVDISKQIASTMDELEAQRLRNLKKTIEEQLTGKPNSKADSQWTDLQRAYGEFYGDVIYFHDTVSKGGRCDEVFEALREKLSKDHQKKDAAAGVTTAVNGKKTTRKKAAQAAMLEIKPNERFKQIILHATNLKLDGQLIWDELALGEINDANLDAFLFVVNERGAAQTASVPATPAGAVVEEFGTESSEVQEPGASGEGEPQRTALFSDAAFEGLVDPESGEVVQRGWVLDALGWLDFPTEPTKEAAAQILDLMRTRYLDPAARYRAQAEKMAAPLEKRAANLEQLFGPYLDAVGKKFLPTHKSDSKPDAKQPHKAGDFSKKTLDLLTGSISWQKDGGTTCVNDAKFYAWLGEKKTEMQALRDKGTEEALEELKQLENLYGLKLKTEAVVDKDKVKQVDAKQLPPGWEALPVNHLAKRTIK